MLFNSLTFILFFCIVLALHNLPFPWQIKKINLLLASYVFYAAWSPPFVILLWAATAVDWFIAKWMSKTEDDKIRKRILLVSVTANLGMLGYFKYGNFFLENFARLMSFFHLYYVPKDGHIALPIGISFYTFVTLSYTIDVYQRKIVPPRSFWDYALLTAFFPHLVAGPILRAAQFLPQCLESRKANSRQLGWGLSLMVFGLFDKIVLADGVMAPVADAVYSMNGKVSWSQAWLGMFAFTTQVFLDFGGYSLCAIGTAMCFGFVFPDNFRFPFAAIGFSDLWKRWHISLSSWLRDYVYIPLGKGRRGTAWIYFDLMVTMTLCGLWHGATLHHMVWGAICGMQLIIERIIVAHLLVSFPRGRVSKFANIGLMLATFLFFNLALVVFRSNGVHNALKMYQAMFTGKASSVTLYSHAQAVCVVLVTIWLLVTHWWLRDSSLEEAVSKMSWWVHCLTLLIMILVIILIPGENRAFIYFQF